MRYAMLIASGMLLATPAHACFFCEEGATNTALFVMGFFGMFMLGMLFICLAYARAGAFKGEHKLELRVLEAEGIVPEGK
ncbi:MAG: hypothetical protein H6839_03520 [Planctomycetes bacterium]|nr:hypothetical protein [Planctomycetota bacterium]